MDWASSNSSDSFIEKSDVDEDGDQYIFHQGEFVLLLLRKRMSYLLDRIKRQSVNLFWGGRIS
jgi:hypothetical protein